MNYITHLNAFFCRASGDGRLTAYHISLYLAVFQLWNLNRFAGKFPASRTELMILSRIGSVNTYAKCIKELDRWKYIRYFPSANRHCGSVDEEGFFALTDELFKEWNWSGCTIKNAQQHPCKDDFITFGRKIGIADKRVDKLLAPFLKEQAGVEILVQRSFLDEGTKRQYINHYHERLEMLNLI